MTDRDIEILRKQNAKLYKDAMESATIAASYAEDAARYRWLLAQFQTAREQYGDVVHDRMVISCDYLYGRLYEAGMEAKIKWIDRRGEQINLSQAIDKAMKAKT